MELQTHFAVFILLISTTAVAEIELKCTECDDNETDMPASKYLQSVTNKVDNKTPWQVCVNFLGKDSLIAQKCYCGGVLISPKWVVSSAHCFRSNNASSSWRKSQFQFVVGMSAGIKRQMFKAKNIILHDQYRPSETACVPGDYDIAIIELDKNVETDAQHVKPLQLPSINTNFDGMHCLIGDWDGSAGTTLSHEEVSIPSDVGICRMNKTALKSDILEGESGGAIACGQNSTILVGVVQIGKKCGSSGIFLPIKEYLNWIGKNTGLFSENRGSTRKKRMAKKIENGMANTTPERIRGRKKIFKRKCNNKKYKDSFTRLRIATNAFMNECFGKYYDPQKVELKNLHKTEQKQIFHFIGHYGKNNKYIDVYNTESLRDILNLIYYFSSGGLQSKNKILNKNIVVRQIINNATKNGFLITAGNFYCYPYKINGMDILTKDLTSGTYPDMFRELINDAEFNNFNGLQQINSFAGTRDYPGNNYRHYAHFTFANLFAESVRNWNSLTIVLSFIRIKNKSTLQMYKQKQWIMGAGSWQGKCTWGNDTLSTPIDTKTKFVNVMNSLKYINENENFIKQDMTKHFCDIFGNLGETKPDCCH